MITKEDYILHKTQKFGVTREVAELAWEVLRKLNEERISLLQLKKTLSSIKGGSELLSIREKGG